MRPWDTLIPLSTPAFRALVGLLVLGCAAQPRPLLVAAPVRQAPLPPEVAPLSDFEPAHFRALPDTSPAPVEPVFDTEAPAACRWTASAWSGPLRITANAEPFASAYEGRAARVTIPEGDSLQGARVSFEQLGLGLSALVAARELDLYLKVPELFDGYVWSRSDAALSWTLATPGRIAFDLRLPARVVPVKGPPRGEKPCNALSLEVEGNDEALSRTLRAGKNTVLQTRWRGDERVPLSRAPGQPVVAFLDTRAECLVEAQTDCNQTEPDEVIVLEKRARSVRIVYALETVVVMGWVPETALQASLERVDADALDLVGVPWGGPVEAFGANDPTRLVDHSVKPLCAWNAPLAVESSGVLRRVGTIASAIPLLPRASRHGWREVVLRHPALPLAAGARLWVPERLLYPCEIRQ